MDLSDGGGETSYGGGETGNAEVIGSPMVLLQGVQNWVRNWIPLAASLLSLILAIVSLVVATHDPGVAVILPSRIVLDDADGGADTPFHPANIYMQPNFVGTGNNSRIELLSRLELTIEADGGGQPVAAEWTQQGKWDYVNEGGTSSSRTFLYSADAAPLLISPNNAQQPLCVFPLPNGFELRPDVRYKLTLKADRVVAGKPLQSFGYISIPKSELEFFKSNYNSIEFIEADLEQASR